MTKWKGALYLRIGKGTPKKVRNKTTWRDRNTGEVWKGTILNPMKDEKDFLGYEPTKASPFGYGPRKSEVIARRQVKQWKEFGAREEPPLFPRMKRVRTMRVR